MGGQQPVMIFDQQGGIKSNVEVGLDDLKEDNENLRVILNMVLDGQKTIIEKLNRIEEKQDLNHEFTLQVREWLVKNKCSEKRFEEEVKKVSNIGIRNLRNKYLKNFPYLSQDTILLILKRERCITIISKANAHGNKYILLDEGAKLGWLSVCYETSLQYDENRIDDIIAFLVNGYKKLVGDEDESD